MSLDITVGLISSVIFWALGWFSKAIWTGIKYRGRNKFWRPFSKKSPVVAYIVDKTGSEGSLGKVSLTDVQAYSDLRVELERLNIPVTLARASAAKLSERESGAVICLGGPKANEVARVILHRFSDKIIPQFVTEKSSLPGNSNYFFSLGGEKYSTAYTLPDPGTKETTSVSRDYALVVYLRELQPKNHEPGLGVVIFGLRGVGTLAAVRFILKGHEIYANVNSHPQESYWALIEFDLSNGETSKHRIVSDGYFSE